MGGLAAVAGQASPGGLSPETLAAIEELRRQNGGELPMPEPSPTPVTMPAPAPAPQGGGIGDMLLGLIRRGMEAVAGSAPAQPAPGPTPAPPTPEELAARNRRLAGGQ